MSDDRQSSKMVERAFKSIIGIFTHPKNVADLRGSLNNIESQATQIAWRAAMGIAPSKKMLVAAKAAGKYGAYDPKAILVPKKITRKWVARQVKARAGWHLCGGSPWNWINITLVARDGAQHHFSLSKEIKPGLLSREDAETNVVDQVLDLLAPKENES